MARLRVLQGTRCALAALAGATRVGRGQEFATSANLEVMSPDGRLTVVNARAATQGRPAGDQHAHVLAPVHPPSLDSPCQILLDAPLPPGRPGGRLQVERTWAVPVSLDTPHVTDPGPGRLAAVARSLEPFTASSWFHTPDGRRHGLPALRDAMAGTPARLLGLGAGLTPCGDDVLVAWAGWLRATGQGVGHLAALVPGAPAATTATSATLLACALDGETSAALNQLFVAVGRGHDPGPAARAVATTGHSSGADALFGLQRLWSATPSTTHYCDTSPGQTTRSTR